MSPTEQFTLDPITLGHKAALGVLRPAEAGDRQAVTATDRVRILNDAASLLGMYYRPYWISATYGITLPNAQVDFELSDFDEDGPIENNLAFSGLFNGYSRVKVGKIVGALGLKPVSGLCATFDPTIMLSGAEDLQEDHLLHVPILAVNGVRPARNVR